MGLKSIVIKSQFGSSYPGKYIKEYTSREDATEALEIEDYVSQHTSTQCYRRSETRCV